MKHIKLFLNTGAVLLASALCQTAHAQIVLGTEYTAILGDVNGTTTPPEALTVDYEVTLASGIYTYSYTINNPSGDLILTGPNTGKPETVDTFQVSIDTTVPGAFVAGSQTGGVYYQDQGVNGLLFGLAGIAPGSSATVTFQSDLQPTWGDVQAQDSVAPSPWSSANGGQQVAVPVPEPTTLIAGALLLMPFGASTLRSLRKNRTLS